MSENLIPVKVSKITCSVHQGISGTLLQLLHELRINAVFVENGRNVRQFVKKRPFFIPGATIRLQDTSTEVFQFIVSLKDSNPVMAAIVKRCNLKMGGRGTVYSQEMSLYGSAEPVRLHDFEYEIPHFHQDMSCITSFLSMPGSSEVCAKLALELGTCVPIITYGKGTGMRDKLGLMRITIPSEKEIINLLAPRHDADGIIRILVEGAKLNKPGRGIIYRTPVTAGITDTRIYIGHQKYAASIEQIIAALDTLHDGTSWRHRFAETDQQQWSQQLTTGNQQITVVCAEGVVKPIVEAAMEAGAGGATTSRLRRVIFVEDPSGNVAHEQCVMIVPDQISKRIVNAVVQNREFKKDSGAFVLLMNAPVTFRCRS